MPFDELLGGDTVERLLLDTVAEQESAAILGATGTGKSSVLAWCCENLPQTHIAVRVPVAGMDDPTDPRVPVSVALGAALQAASEQDVYLDVSQRAALEEARPAERTSTHVSRRPSAKIGGGPVPAEMAVQLGSLSREYHREDQPFDAVEGLGRLVGIFATAGLTLVIVIEDTESALGVDAPEHQRNAFFESSLRLLLRESEITTLIAVQRRYAEERGYAAVRSHLLEVQVPELGERAAAGLERILRRRLEFNEIDADLSEVLDLAALPDLVSFYGRSDRSLRNVLLALDLAAAAALVEDR